MRFTLTYDGPLPPSGNKSKLKYVWMVRRAIHSQLEGLWQISEVLRRLPSVTRIPLDIGYMSFEVHHSDPRDMEKPELKDNSIDLCEPIESCGHSVLPLVRESLATTCSLDILLLRQEEPGHLFSQSGDIDGRIKTLFDGLRGPQSMDEWKGQKKIPKPFYCLLQDDKLITDFRLKTDRLLACEGTDSKDVRLIVEVVIRASIVKRYNLPLLGD